MTKGARAARGWPTGRALAAATLAAAVVQELLLFAPPRRRGGQLFSSLIYKLALFWREQAWRAGFAPTCAAGFIIAQFHTFGVDMRKAARIRLIPVRQFQHLLSANRLPPSRRIRASDSNRFARSRCALPRAKAPIFAYPLSRLRFIGRRR